MFRRRCEISVRPSPAAVGRLPVRTARMAVALPDLVDLDEQQTRPGAIAAVGVMMYAGAACYGLGGAAMTDHDTDREQFSDEEMAFLRYVRFGELPRKILPEERVELTETEPRRDRPDPEPWSWTG